MVSTLFPSLYLLFHESKYIALVFDIHDLKRDQGKTQVRLPGQLNFALGQMKMESWWSGGQVKLAPLVFWVDKE